MLSSRKRACSAVFGDPLTEVSSVSLESPCYSQKILSGMQMLRGQELLCDYTLLADDCTLKVHRTVMVACSDYFHAMLTGEMRESREQQVELKGVTAVGLQAVVNFAYTGTLSLNLDNLEDVLSAGTHLQMSEAVELCCQFMQMAITIDNCVDILNLTELYSLPNSRLSARKFILKHFETFSESEQYDKLNHDQLASMLGENSLKVLSEFKLFQLVLRWITNNRPEREVYTGQLMSQLRLPLLSGEELVDQVSRVDVMRRNKECNELLTEAKDYHIVVSKQPLSQSSRTQVRSDKQSLVMCYEENLESYTFETEKHAFLKDASLPMYSPCVCVVDNFMYACGGKYDSNENNEIATARCFRYDPRFDTWFELASMNEARKDFAMVAFNNMLITIAGQDENMVMCSVESFSIAKNDWESRTGTEYCVYGHTATVCQDLVYLCGGQKFDGHCSYVKVYNPPQDKWQSEQPMYHARSNHVAVEAANNIFVLGGNTEDSYGFPVPVTSIERFNPLTHQWTICEAQLNIRESGACVVDDTIYIVGGINGQHYFSELLQKYSNSEDKVETVAKFPTRVHGRACCILTLPQYV